MPQPTRTEKKNVYGDSTLRRLFRQPRFTHLRQAKPVRLAIRQHNISIWPYNETKLVQIVRVLLQDCVFKSEYIAQSHFPELFKSSRPQAPLVREPNKDASSVPSSIHLGYAPPDPRQPHNLACKNGLRLESSATDHLETTESCHTDRNDLLHFALNCRIPVLSFL